MSNSPEEDVIQRLIDENGALNHKLKCITLELQNNQYSAGLSEVQGIRVLSHKCIEQEKTIQDLNNKLVLLQSRFYRNRDELIQSLLNELDNDATR